MLGTELEWSLKENTTLVELLASLAKPSDNINIQIKHFFELIQLQIYNLLIDWMTKILKGLLYTRHHAGSAKTKFSPRTERLYSLVNMQIIKQWGPHQRQWSGLTNVWLKKDPPWDQSKGATGC